MTLATTTNAAWPATGASQGIALVFVPFVVARPSGCQPIAGVVYGTLDVNGPHGHDSLKRPEGYVYAERASTMEV